MKENLNFKNRWIKAKVEIESNELDNELKRQDLTMAYIHKRNEFVKAGIAPRVRKAEER